MISIERARKLYLDADPVHDFAHVLRVLSMARQLAQMEGADETIVEQAALLHDISRPLDENTHNDFAMHTDTEQDHAVLAAREARRLLNGEETAFIDAVAHAIEAHRFRNSIEPETIEAQVLFDADKLDAIGAVGVARAFAYAGAHSMPLWREVSGDYIPGESAEVHTPHHEFIVKLQRIQTQMKTNSGREIAKVRHSFMVNFFEQMQAEVLGKR